MNRPNLLFLFTDEQRADTMAAYGNTAIHTPHLNRLAEQSVVFRKCYVTQPVCTPSRSSLMTGLYPHTNGCTQNNAPLGDDTPCLAEMISGYRTAYFGKWHLGDEIFRQHGFDHWVSVEDMYIPYYRDERDRNARSTYHHWLVERGYRPPNQEDGAPGVFTRGVTARFAEQDCKPAFLAEQVSSWLQERGREAPFVACVNFLEPHMPFTGPRNSQYARGDVSMPRNFESVPGQRHHLKARMFHRAYSNQGYGDFRLDAEQGWRRLIANYWGLVSQVDTAIGTILETLAACGLEDDTIVVFTSDHGDMMASHGLLAKCVMYEEAVTVPLLVKVPGVSPRREDAPVSQIDLVPTLLDMLGQPIPADLEGKSLRSAIEQGTWQEKRDVFIEWNGNDSGIAGFEGEGAEPPECLRDLGSREELLTALSDPLRTIVTSDGWKLNYSPACGRHELYDLNRDPCENGNLYRGDAHHARFERLKGRIKAWGMRTGDAVASSI